MVRKSNLVKLPNKYKYKYACISTGAKIVEVFKYYCYNIIKNLYITYKYNSTVFNINIVKYYQNISYSIKSVNQCSCVQA